MKLKPQDLLSDNLDFFPRERIKRPIPKMRERDEQHRKEGKQQKRKDKRFIEHD